MRIWVGLCLVLAALLSGCATAVQPTPPSASPDAEASPSGSPTPTPFTAGSGVALPTPLPSDEVIPEATETPGPPPPGTTPFPTPGATITPNSTRVIGSVRRPDGAPAPGVCVVLEKGICPIATDERGVWFTDIPMGPTNWNFIYKVQGDEVGRQTLFGSPGGELRLPTFTLPGSLRG